MSNPLNRHISAATAVPESVRKLREKVEGKDAELSKADAPAVIHVNEPMHKGDPEQAPAPAAPAPAEAAPPAPEQAPVLESGAPLTKGGDFVGWDALIPNMAKADPSSYDPSAAPDPKMQMASAASPMAIAAALAEQGQETAFGLSKGIEAKLSLATPAGDVPAPRDRAGGAGMVGKQLSHGRRSHQAMGEAARGAVRAAGGAAQRTRRAIMDTPGAQESMDVARTPPGGQLAGGDTRATHRGTQRIRKETTKQAPRGLRLTGEMSGKMDGLDALADFAGRMHGKQLRHTAGPGIAKTPAPGKPGASTGVSGSRQQQRGVMAGRMTGKKVPSGRRQGLGGAVDAAEHAVQHSTTSRRGLGHKFSQNRALGQLAGNPRGPAPGRREATRTRPKPGDVQTVMHARMSAEMADLVGKIKAEAKRKKGKKKHPVSEAQRRWAFAAEERGELPRGKAREWSRRVKGRNLPDDTEKSEPFGDLVKAVGAEDFYGKATDGIQSAVSALGAAKMSGRKGKKRKVQDYLERIHAKLSGKQEAPLPPRRPGPGRTPPAPPPGGRYPRPGPGRSPAPPPPRDGKMSGKIVGPSDYSGRMHGKQEAPLPPRRPGPGRVPPAPPPGGRYPRPGPGRSPRPQPAPRMQRSEAGDNLDLRKGGLYSFSDSSHETKQALPAKMLPEYLAAFVEEAYEHEKQECAHRKITPKADQDLADFWAKRIMGELVQYMRKNKDLARAAKGKDYKSISDILRTRGLVQPESMTDTPTDRDSYYAMGAPLDGKSAEVMAFSQSRRGHFHEPLDKSTNLALADRPPEHDFGIVDDKPDPFALGAEKERVRVASLTSPLHKGDWRASVSHDCPVHGFRDLTKSQNLSNPYAKCTCG
jgi:hypothetical protein